MSSFVSILIQIDLSIELQQAANGVIPCLAMAQKVKRLPDLSPAPDNEPADLELGDTAMMLLGLLSGVGEQLLGNEGWLIFPSEGIECHTYQLSPRMFPVVFIESTIYSNR